MKRAESSDSRAHAEAHSLPGVHAAQLCELLERWGIAPEDLLGPFGLRLDALSDPEARLPISTVIQLTERARTLTGEPGLGYYLGLQMRISAHGYLGFAAMTASTLREAAELAVRFAPTRTTALALRLEEHGDKAAVVFEERCSFGSVRDIVVFSTMIGFWRIGDTLTGKELLGDAELAFPLPTYALRFANLLPGGIAFDRPDNRLVFDRKYLDLKLTMADAGALKLARDQCERELDRLGYRKSLLTRVRALLAARDRELPSLVEMAESLGTSSRTLKRKLADEGASYSDLVDEVQLGRATTLLRSELTVDEIAARLGYSDSANFTRAFRRWTGKTPTAFRNG